MTGLDWSRNKTNRRMADARRADGDAAAYTAEMHDARNAALRRVRTKLAEPVLIAQFPRNAGNDVVVVQLRQFEGQALFDARQNFVKPDGKLQPTRSGISVAISQLAELKRAVDKAVVMARLLGLLEGDAGA